MNATLPTGPSGRLLALGLLGAVLLAGWVGIAAPLAAWHAERAEAIDGRRMIAQRMEALAAVLPALQEAAAARSADSGAASSLLEGGTDAVAGAALQGLLRDMATRVGASLNSIETLAAAPAGAYRRIGLRLSLSAPWPVLVQLLQAVEQARPRMVVDELELHNSQMQADTGEVMLNAAFTAYAFRGDAGSGAVP
jgi:general secretion pathway protein M